MINFMNKDLFVNIEYNYPINRIHFSTLSHRMLIFGCRQYYNTQSGAHKINTTR